jgi:hypothetical protein
LGRMTMTSMDFIQVCAERAWRRIEITVPDRSLILDQSQNQIEHVDRWLA